MTEGTGWGIGRLGRVAIRVDVTWFAFAFGLVVVTWHWASRSSPGYAVLASAVVLVTFVAALVIHEGTHLVAARRLGLRADRITVWAFGGRSYFVGDAPSAGAKVAVACSGAVVSAAIGALALIAAGSLQDGHLRHELTVFGRICLGIGAINALPAYWTDANDALRAILSRGTRDPERAWRIAARTGQIVAVPMAVLLWVYHPWKDTVLPLAAPGVLLYTIWVASTERSKRLPADDDSERGDGAQGDDGAKGGDGTQPGDGADPA